MPVEVSAREGTGKLFPMLKIWGDRPGHPAVALNRPVCLVGRRGMHLSLEAPTVSRTHALIVNDARHVYIRDLASRNGTTVNGAAVHEAELADAAVVRIGSYALRCEAGFPKSPEDVPVASAPAVELHVDGHAVPIPLGQKTVLIGQREGCEIQLVDPDASPVHAVVFELSGKRHIRDLNSENGTFVNGQPVRQAELKDGDEIRIGRTKVRYIVAGSAAAAARPAADAVDVDVEPLTSLDEITEAAVEPAAGSASPPVPRSLDEVLGDALAEPVEAELGSSEGGAPEADIDVDIDIEPETIDGEQAEFGSTALESNLERLAASPVPPPALGDLEEPQLAETAPETSDEPMEVFVDHESGADDAAAVAEAPQVDEPAKPPAAPPAEPLAASQPAQPEATPIADAASQDEEAPDTSVLMTGAAPDALSDSLSSVAVEADGLMEAVDASTGPIAMADDSDDVIEVVEDETPAPAPEPTLPPTMESTKETDEVLDAPGEVVDGKIVSPTPFADAGPLTEAAVAPKPADVVRAAPASAPTGVFAKADLTEPARPPGLTTGAHALPAPPAGGVAPAPQARLEPMDDAAVADVVARNVLLPPAPAKFRKPRPTRVRIKQLSRRVRALSERVATLEAALLVTRGTVEKPSQIPPA